MRQLWKLKKRTRWAHWAMAGSKDPWKSWIENLKVRSGAIQNLTPWHRCEQLQGLRERENMYASRVYIFVYICICKMLWKHRTYNIHSNAYIIYVYIYIFICDIIGEFLPGYLTFAYTYLSSYCFTYRGLRYIGIIVSVYWPFFLVSTRSLKWMDDQNIHSAIQASKVCQMFTSFFLKPKTLMSFRRWFFSLKFQLVSRNFCLSQVGNIVSFPRFGQVVPAMLATWHCWYRPVEHHATGPEVDHWRLTFFFTSQITNSWKHVDWDTNRLERFSLGVSRWRFHQALVHAAWPISLVQVMRWWIRRWRLWL